MGWLPDGPLWDRARGDSPRQEVGVRCIGAGWQLGRLAAGGHAWRTVVRGLLRVSEEFAPFVRFSEFLCCYHSFFPRPRCMHTLEPLDARAWEWQLLWWGEVFASRLAASMSTP